MLQKLTKRFLLSLFSNFLLLYWWVPGWEELLSQSTNQKPKQPCLVKRKESRFHTWSRSLNARSSLRMLWYRLVLFWWQRSTAFYWWKGKSECRILCGSPASRINCRLQTFAASWIHLSARLRTRAYCLSRARLAQLNLQATKLFIVTSATKGVTTSLRIRVSFKILYCVIWYSLWFSIVFWVIGCIWM